MEWGSGKNSGEGSVKKTYKQEVKQERELAKKASPPTYLLQERNGP
jgi:hypothetical protein